MACSFCGRPNGYAFDGFLLCPSCAAVSQLALATDRGEVHASIRLAGRSHYLYTASNADTGTREQAARLRAHDATRQLIAAAGPRTS